MNVGYGITKMEMKHFSEHLCKGLINNGNTCYLNSSLTCLAHCSTFTYPVIAYSYNTCRVYTTLHDLFKTIWVSDQVGDTCDLIAALQPQFKDIMNLRQQNDAMEFIMVFLDILNTELGTTERKAIHNKRLRGANRLVDFMKCSWTNSHALNFSFIVDTCYGQNVLQLKCKSCGGMEHKSEIFLNMAVPLDNSSNGGLLEKIIKTFVHENVQRECDFCKAKCEGSCSQKIWKLPKLLIIHLKRFDSSNIKVHTPVDVPETIDFNDFVLYDTDTKFQLKAISCHSGSTNYGHYFSLCKNARGAWYLYDDESEPKQLNSYKDVNSVAYYILFYEML